MANTEQKQQVGLISYLSHLLFNVETNTASLQKSYSSPSLLNSACLLFIRYAQKSESKKNFFAKQPTINLNLYERLKEVDEKSESSDLKQLQTCIDSLTSLSEKYPDNLEILWRIGMVHYNIGIKNKTDKAKVKEHIQTGLVACQKALHINPNLYQAHKWYGLLRGYLTEFQSSKEKIVGAYTFKKHIDIALSLNPNDATLHHVRGRFVLSAADIKWYERQIATTLFAKPPFYTHDQAMKYLLEADKITKGQWKENKLYLAKCQIALGKYKEAINYLLEAKLLGQDNSNVSVNEEVERLYKKYNNYKDK